MSTIEDHPILALISSPEEADQLAQELADDYIQYFDVNVTREQDRYQDAIEECLAHLEEVISALDGYKQTGETLDRFVDIVNNKCKTLNKLYDQVESVEEYLYETNRCLDQLDATMSELACHQSSRSGKIKKIIDMIPGMSRMPRLGFFSGLTSLISDGTTTSTASFEENETENQELVPMEEVLNQIHSIESSVLDITKGLNKRLYGANDGLPEQPSQTEVDKSMAMLSLNSSEGVDDSWQELL